MERLPGISLLTQSTVDGLFHSPVVVNVEQEEAIIRVLIPLTGTT